jgi:polyisoprenoid-binding protein YceI
VSDHRRFRIDPDRSTVAIEARSSVHPIRGEARGVEGMVELALDGGRPDLSRPPQARLELLIAQLESGNRLYDSEMQRRVDARTYPAIAGELRQVQAGTSDGRFHVQGDLTFHGRTQLLAADLAVVFEGDAGQEQRLIADWEQTIDVRDFGVDPPRLLMLRVHPEVLVRVHLEADAEPAHGSGGRR